MCVCACNFLYLHACCRITCIYIYFTYKNDINKITTHTYARASARLEDHQYIYIYKYTYIYIYIDVYIHLSITQNRYKSRLHTYTHAHMHNANKDTYMHAIHYSQTCIRRRVLDWLAADKTGIHASGKFDSMSAEGAQVPLPDDWEDFPKAKGTYTAYGVGFW